MAAMETSKDTNWWVFTLPALLPIAADPLLIVLSLGVAVLAVTLITWAASSGGPAWPHHRSRIGKTPIPGIRGLPILGSLLSLGGLPHRTLAALSRLHKNSSAASKLMSFSLGSTPAVVSSDPITARELLSHPLLSDRPVKLSARELFFSRAIGFAPSGTYWRFLRRLASSHLFSPRRLAFHSAARAADASTLLRAVAAEHSLKGAVLLRRHLQFAALNNITGTTFGIRYEDSSHPEARELQEMVREGFDLLGSFNISDNLPWLSFLDPKRISKRCKALVPRVRQFVSRVIDEHRLSANAKGDAGDFVDVLLSLQDSEKLELDDMIAVLWEMVFRGTDTTALLTEWAMAELVLNPRVQARLRREIDEKVGTNRAATDSDVSQMPYLQAVIKESLRAHPPGPLLSWARLATGDVQLSNGMVVPEGTTTMVNMWAITHDEAVWDRPEEFRPERFLAAEGGEDVDVRGNDLRLAPFGSGRRVCPGRSLGLVTVGLWVARLVQCFEWSPARDAPVSLDEVLKLSLEMKNPLVAVALPRENINACF